MLGDQTARLNELLREFPILRNKCNDIAQQINECTEMDEIIRLNQELGLFENLYNSCAIEIKELSLSPDLSESLNAIKTVLKRSAEKEAGETEDSVLAIKDVIESSSFISCSGLEISPESFNGKEVVVFITPSSATNTFWTGIKCNSCNQFFSGIRYKCQSCHNYNHCGLCHTPSPVAHGHHQFLKMEPPVTTFIDGLQEKYKRNTTIEVVMLVCDAPDEETFRTDIAETPWPVFNWHSSAMAWKHLQRIFSLDEPQIAILSGNEDAVKSMCFNSHTISVMRDKDHYIATPLWKNWVLQSQKNDIVVPPEKSLTVSAATSITLVHLSDGDIPEFSLQEYDLNNHPPFGALSHVWGSVSKIEVPFASGTHEILIESLQKWNELVDMMQKLKEHTAKTGTAVQHFWIDFLCVDQNDSVRRQATMMIMNKLYSICDFTVVFAGSSKRSEWPEGEWQNVMEEQDYTAAVARVAEECTGEIFQDSMSASLLMANDLFWFRGNLNWTRRAWTLQEGVLPPKLWFYSPACGFFVDHDAMAKLYNAYHEERHEEALQFSIYQQLASDDPDIMLYSLMTDAMYDLFVVLRQRNFRTSQIRITPNFIVVSIVRREAAKVEDKPYIFTLMLPHVFKEPILPNYEKDGESNMWKTIWTEMAHAGDHSCLYIQGLGYEGMSWLPLVTDEDRVLKSIRELPFETDEVFKAQILEDNRMKLDLPNNRVYTIRYSSVVELYGIGEIEERVTAFCESCGIDLDKTLEQFQSSWRNSANDKNIWRLIHTYSWDLSSHRYVTFLAVDVGGEILLALVDADYTPPAGSSELTRHSYYYGDMIILNVESEVLVALSTSATPIVIRTVRKSEDEVVRVGSGMMFSAEMIPDEITSVYIC